MTKTGSRLRIGLPRGAFYPGDSRCQGDFVKIPSSGHGADRCDVLAGELARLLGMDAPAAGGDSGERFWELVLAAHGKVLMDAGFYVQDSARLVHDGDGLAALVPKIPCAPEIALELFNRLASLCDSTATGKAPVAAWLPGLQREIGKVQVPIPAASHMARAAHELGMPILEMHGSFLQVGYGANSLALTGSITENTSSIGVHFAREKAKANALLARAGFPIAEGGLVRDLPHALRCAEQLGYPVVVKPADRDGGMAVSSDIRTPGELEQAFARARSASPRVIVEKHVEGTDYRLLLHEDELLVVIERTRGGVTGNGRDTVAALLDALNADPRRGEGPNALLHKIAFDDEARLMLQRQGLTPESVPEDGRFVPLRRAANHALGGMVRLVDDIHPDNVDLARRAMKVLRLDIAGIDMLLPDVTKSWREAGGAICEVNAQPYIGEVIGKDYYKAILEKVVPGGGRIPLVLAVGAPDADTLAEIAQVPGLAIVDADGARRDGFPLSVKRMPWLTVCQAALYDCETTAALFVLDSDEPLPPLSPADRFSAALVLAPPPPGAEAILRRADTIHATEKAAPALREAGLAFTTLQPAEIAGVLKSALAA